MHNVLHRATLHLVGAHPAVDAVALKMEIEEINCFVFRGQRKFRYSTKRPKGEIKVSSKEDRETRVNNAV